MDNVTLLRALDEMATRLEKAKDKMREFMIAIARIIAIEGYCWFFFYFIILNTFWKRITYTSNWQITQNNTRQSIDISNFLNILQS